MSDLKKHIVQANLRRLSGYPLHVLFIKVLGRLGQYLLAFSLFFVAVILYILNWRIQLIDMTRIGHLAVTALCTINDKNVDLSKLKIIVPINGPIANDHILKYMPDNYQFYSGQLLRFIIKSISFWSFITLPSDEYIIQPRRQINAYNLLSGCFKHFTLDEEDNLWLKEQIKGNYNLKSDWFVLIHNRTDHYSRSDREAQDYRNCNIENYNTAIDQIISLGGTVFRIGINNGDTLKSRPYLYDVRSPDHERLQLCLSANCKFLLGCSSGAAFMATFFGKPVALANLIPMTTMPYTKNDLGLHKHIVDIKSGKKLSIDEALSSSVSDAFVSSMYGIEYTYLENNNNDLLRLTSAMIDQIDGLEINTLTIKYKSTDYAYGTMARVML